MKFKFFGKIIVSSLVLAFALLSFACQSGGETTEAVKAQSPREAYKLLYEAVKSKKSERIKQMMSDNTMTFAGIVSQQKNEPIEKVIENGFAASTLADNLPDSRDQRVNGNFGALEVFSQKDNRWEDLPFVLENGAWKLAVGDSFNGNYKSPGKGQAQLEIEASNPDMFSNANASSANANVGATEKTKKNDAGREADRAGKRKRVVTVEVPDESTNKSNEK